ncbi:TonB-dependent receptor [Phenylobacterium sp.]|uniref:TonB-dependent receptor n=1 Tax=Phenylobacterium sp. TaxID=1871053 RepID=UPI00272F0247|nr:TonB-dependent receptor [Phenylobacterium sp.]MDP1875191.1 TonB-dependent receptor [Phenylobacterium sp.]
MSNLKSRFFAVAALCALSAGLTPSVAAAFQVPSGALASALEAYAEQSGQQILYEPAAVAGQTSPGLNRPLEPRAALQHLLAGSGLTARESAPGVYVIKRPDRARTEPAAMVVATSPAIARVATTPGPERAAPPMIEELIITGSLIRGGEPPTSPLLQFDRGDIDKAGHGTLGDALAALPQNFSGSGSPTSALIGSDGRSTNDLAATGINLRGLGASATLVLVNGRRMGGVGTKGDFADVSALPTAVVDRVDVLLDGASALYGSDAIGGVVNVHLKRRLDAPESRMRLGLATEGGGEELQASHAHGLSWDSGDLVAAYEYGRRWGLRAEERDVTATSDLRSLGGTDRRTFYSHPANLLVFDASAGAYRVGWSVPPGQSGAALRPQDFIVGAPNLQNQRQGGDTLPEETRHNLYVSLTQELDSSIRVLAEARYNRRDNLIARPAPVSVFTVNQRNPFFVSPNGSSSHTVGYAFSDEFGPSLSDGRAESIGLSAGLEIDLPEGWRADIYGASALEIGRRNTERLINSHFVNEAVGAIVDDPRTAYSPTVDGYFNPFGDGGANGPAVLGYIGSGYTRGKTMSAVMTFDAKADGPLWELPAGPLKAAIGVQARKERFKPQTTSLVSGPIPVRSGGTTFSRAIEAAFLELRAPLLSADQQVPLVDRLELSLAARAERYGDFGQTTNPKVGLLWAPIPGLQLRGSYGTSFRAPNMPELYQLQNASPVLVGSGASQTLALVQTGGNLDLEPESAVTWSFGFDYRPQTLSGLTLSATWFDVAFQDQIGQPVLADIPNALTNNAYAPFVDRIDPSRSEDVERVKAVMAISTSSNIGLFPPEAYRALIDARFVNTGEVVVRGLDVQATYSWAVQAHQFTLDASLSYLADYVRRFTPTAQPVQLVDTANQPVDLRGRLTGAWTKGPLALSATVNYVDSYRSETGAEIAAWTPVDAQARWTPVASGALDGVELALSVQNLFNEDPPFYDSPLGVGYDPANASPLGRTIALQITRRW